MKTWILDFKEIQLSWNWVIVYIFSIGAFNKEISKGKFQLFKHDVGGRALYELMAFFVSSVASSFSFGVAVWTIATIAKLDAFMTSTITCLRVNGSENVRGIDRRWITKLFQRFFQGLSRSCVSCFENGRGSSKLKSWSRASIWQPKTVVKIHFSTVLDLSGSQDSIFKTFI